MVSVILNLLKAQGDSHDAEVACYNGPKSHVIVGSIEAIDVLKNLVMSNSSLRDTVRTKKLKGTHEFHFKFYGAFIVSPRSSGKRARIKTSNNASRNL